MTVPALITIIVLALCIVVLLAIVGDAVSGLRESKRFQQELRDREARTAIYNAERAAERAAYEADLARARAILKG
jgi:hypothetical protein